MSSDSEVDRYRCPYCSTEPYTSTKEREIRLHIEESSDGDHSGREGFSPMTSIGAVDADGNPVDNATGESLKREPDGFDDVCEPDDDWSPVQRRIIATKMMHPDYTSEQIVDFLEDRDDCPTEEYTRQTIREYFGTTEAARGARPFEDFNDRQQNAIDAAARYELGEFESYAEAAEAIDEKRGYVNTCRYQYEAAVNRRMKALEEENRESEDTVRRNNGVGTYAGPEKGIDATMQHISERATTNKTSEEVDDDTNGQNKESESAEPYAEVVREKIDLLKKLVINDELDAEVAFDEVEQMVVEVSPSDRDSGDGVTS